MLKVPSTPRGSSSSCPYCGHIETFIATPQSTHTGPCENCDTMLDRSCDDMGNVTVTLGSEADRIEDEIEFE